MRVVWKALPESGEGLSYTRLYLEARKICRIGSEAFTKYLNELVRVGLVKHDGRLYKRSLVVRVFYKTQQELLAHRTTLKPDREPKCPVLYCWPTYTSDFEPELRNVEDIEGLFSYLVFMFARDYFNYVLLLQSIVDVPTWRFAKETYDLRSSIEIESRRLELAKFVYDHRETLKVGKVSVPVAMFRYMFPRKTLSEIASEISQNEPFTGKNL